MLTPLQKTEFALLECFVSICSRLNLRYYLVCGSALGAVKYGGFIPWDDDIDVGMPREDYNRFLSMAPSLLPDHLFLQNYISDPAFPHLYSKLRNSKTTYIENNVSHLPIHHGVYIDIFPLDGYPIAHDDQKALERVKADCQKKLSCAFRLDRNLKAKIGCLLRRALCYHKRTKSVLERYTHVISQTPTSAAVIWCNHGNWQGRLEYAPREQYGQGTMMKFEGLDVCVPEQYDAYLTQKYGDWLRDIPLEQQHGHHYYSVMDLEHSYTQYCNLD